jgi:hypothetical protein
LVILAPAPHRWCKGFCFQSPSATRCRKRDRRHFAGQRRGDTALAVSWLATATTGIALPCGQIQWPITLPGWVGVPNHARRARPVQQVSSQLSLLMLTSCGGGVGIFPVHVAGQAKLK